MSDVKFDFEEGSFQVNAGENMEFSYQVPSQFLDELQAIETSIVWVTEGKGSEDIGVHFFKRMSRRELELQTAGSAHRIQTKMPRSPLSYSGFLLKIKWQIRVKMFFSKGRQVINEREFILGNTIAPEQLETELNLYPLGQMNSEGPEQV